MFWDFKDLCDHPRSQNLASQGPLRRPCMAAVGIARCAGLEHACLVSYMATTTRECMAKGSGAHVSCTASALL